MGALFDVLDLHACGCAGLLRALADALAQRLGKAWGAKMRMSLEYGKLVIPPA